jgi:hypothetical protein
VIQLGRRVGPRSVDVGVGGETAEPVGRVECPGLPGVTLLLALDQVVRVVRIGQSARQLSGASERVVPIAAVGDPVGGVVGVDFRRVGAVGVARAVNGGVAGEFFGAVAAIVISVGPGYAAVGGVTVLPGGGEAAEPVVPEGLAAACVLLVDRLTGGVVNLRLGVDDGAVGVPGVRARDRLQVGVELVGTGQPAGIVQFGGACRRWPAP